MDTLLKRDHPELFHRLHPGTIQHWLVKQGRGFNERTLDSVERGHVLAGSGHVGILSKFPDLVEDVKTKLKNLRKSGVPVGVFLTCSIMLAAI